MVATTSKSQTNAAFYPTRIDLALDTRKAVVELLNGTLAATTDLRTQTKQAHWNVKGKDFYQLHLLFDEMADELEEYSDMVAERGTALAGTARGTARMAADCASLSEYYLDAVGGIEHVAAVAEQYAAYAKHLREGIAKADELGDMDTSDLYTEISRTIDKRLWFLEAHLVG